MDDLWSAAVGVVFNEAVRRMVGAFRKRAGKLIDIDLTKLAADVSASRDYLIDASGYRPDLFKTSAPAPAAA